MNKNFLVFALLMIVLGAALNFYLLSLIGVLIFFSALLSSQRQPQRPAPATSRDETRRMAPPKPMRMETPASPSKQMPVPAASMPAPVAAQSLSYSPALFPTAMFPSLSQMGAPPQVPETPAPATAAGGDEVLAMGAVLALLKLALG